MALRYSFSEVGDEGEWRSACSGSRSAIEGVGGAAVGAERKKLKREKREVMALAGG
jgi:hypothetical protein